MTNEDYLRIKNAIKGMHDHGRLPKGLLSHSDFEYMEECFNAYMRHEIYESFMPTESANYLIRHGVPLVTKGIGYAIHYTK